MRLPQLQSYLHTQGWEGCVVEDPTDLFYLTGLRLSLGRLFATQDDYRLFVDGRYLSAVQADGQIAVEPLEDTLQKIYVERCGIRHLYFDSGKITYAQHKKLAEMLPVELLAHPAPLRMLRAVKSAEEMVAIRKSAALTFAGMQYLFSSVTCGMTEKAVAWEFEKYCRERGASGMAFSPIVAFGENGGFPHHRAGDTVWDGKMPILCDVGCVVDGYASDLTRVLFTEKHPLETLYAITQEAFFATAEICRPGYTCRELDEKARERMRAHGVEKLFMHSLGHGIGLDTHEFPRISSKGEDQDVPLQTGMVVTIEPGLYQSGHGGVRYENMLYVQNDSAENLFTGQNFSGHNIATKR